ncbi:DUF411 domain-containing protein [Helicobacter mesocricetorum]|uniref:DUF411 domain-containing protein n=1 Tax=Helicobacter mesocricetorum TaxID=87012 RepID=UPI000CF1B653|nr:DUF411 domain-containing protein [Helicobacter mesocricetorum]
MKNKFIRFLGLGLLPLSLFGTNTIELYNTPFCGCCKMWEEYMTKKGYEIHSSYAEDIREIKQKYQIHPKFESCHTGIIDEYVVEGHVPEDAIKWLLENKPKDVIGISVPGMPIGSPGMEQGNIVEDYPVIIMYKNGQHKVYGIYRGHTLIQKKL